MRRHDRNEFLIALCIAASSSILYEFFWLLSMSETFKKTQQSTRQSYSSNRIDPRTGDQSSNAFTTRLCLRLYRPTPIIVRVVVSTARSVYEGTYADDAHRKSTSLSNRFINSYCYAVVVTIAYQYKPRVPCSNNVVVFYERTRRDLVAFVDVASTRALKTTEHYSVSSRVSRR